GRERERLVPFDFAELARAAFADAQKRLRQSRRRIVLHDPGRALGADHALVDRVLRIAVDVADAAVLEVHADAAATGTHVARGLLDLVAGRLVEIQLGVRHDDPRDAGAARGGRGNGSRSPSFRRLAAMIRAARA